MDNPAGAYAAARRQPNKLNAVALRVLHNPSQFRVLLMVVIFGVWYAGVSGPMSEGIDETTRKVDRERKRLGLARDVERLRARVDRFQDRLPRETDSNEWLQYMLAGAREFPIRLAVINTEAVKDVGPYKAVVIKMDVEGSFEDVDAFLRWVESNRRLFRVDAIHIGPARDSRKMLSQLTVLGVMG